MTDPAPSVATLPLYVVHPEPYAAENAETVAEEKVRGRSECREMVVVRWGESRVHLLPSPLPSELDERLLLPRDRASSQANAFRLLRHRLSCRDDPRIVVVTSAEPGEGKTTCAVNLAAALGEESSLKVLLLEANTSSPALAQLFGLDELRCVAQQFATANDISGPWIFCDIPELGVHVGAVDPRKPAPPLERFLFECSIHQLRTHYDYIIIDTPAALHSADVNLVAECADGVVLASRAKVSRRQAIRRATEQLDANKVCGVVLLDSVLRHR